MSIANLNWFRQRVLTRSAASGAAMARHSRSPPRRRGRGSWPTSSPAPAPDRRLRADRHQCRADRARPSRPLRTQLKPRSSRLRDAANARLEAAASGIAAARPVRAVRQPGRRALGPNSKRVSTRLAACAPVVPFIDSARRATTPTVEKLPRQRSQSGTREADAIRGVVPGTHHDASNRLETTAARGEEPHPGRRRLSSAPVDSFKTHLNPEGWKQAATHHPGPHGREVRGDPVQVVRSLSRGSPRTISSACSPRRAQDTIMNENEPISGSHLVAAQAGIDPHP